MNVFELRKAKSLLHLEQAQRRQFTIGLIMAIISFLVITQLNTERNVEKRLNTQTPTELGQIIRNMTIEKDSLLTEVQKLSLDIYKYRQLSEQKTLNLDQAIKNLDTMKIASGRVAITGPGVDVKINDYERLLADYDLVDLVQELRASGAEAIAINGVRITGRSFFNGKQGSLFVNGKKIRLPVTVKAIGNASVMEQALNMPGGYSSTISTLQGVSMEIKQSESLYIGEERIEK